MAAGAVAVAVAVAGWYASFCFASGPRSQSIGKMLHGIFLASDCSGAILALFLVLLASAAPALLIDSDRRSLLHFLVNFAQSLTHRFRFMQQWQRAPTPLHTIQQFTTAGVEEVMVSKPYGITVSFIHEI